MPRPTPKGSIDASCATTGYHFDQINNLGKTQNSKDDLFGVHESAYKDARSTLKDTAATGNIAWNAISSRDRTYHFLDDMLDGTIVMSMVTKLQYWTLSTTNSMNCSLQPMLVGTLPLSNAP